MSWPADSSLRSSSSWISWYSCRFAHYNIIKIYYFIYRLPVAERVGCGTPCLLWSLGVREVVGTHPAPGQYMKSIHPTRKLVRFSLLKCPSIINSKFGTTLSPWESVSYRPSASPSYDASSHVKNYAYSGKLLLVLLLICPTITGLQILFHQNISSFQEHNYAGL